jgi:biotin transport system substrate-specific component
MQAKQLQLMVYASLMAALIAVGAYLHIPLGPVPIVLQNLFVLLAALLLGGRWALIAMGIYLLVGAIGIPVFAGGKGGLAHFMGPTGGYLIGFAVCAFITGFISERANGSLAVNTLAVIVGSLLVYACGVPWLKLVTGMTWAKAITVGMLPFLIGDIIKATAAILLARAVRPVLGRHLKGVSPA